MIFDRYNRLLRRKVDRHLAELHRRAMKLIDRYREAVVAVADRLCQRRHLSGEEIRIVYEENRPGRAPDSPIA